jgi:tRNA (guanine37-N1)-methyltransferase
MIRSMDSILRFDVLSLFPKTLEGFIGDSIIARAIDNRLLEVNSLDIRRWAEGKHRETDDRPFGGGAGMVMKPEPLFAAVEEIADESSTVIYMAPDGEKLTTSLCKEFAQEKHIVILSGHYEGVDQRVRDHIVTREVSVGDYVLTNGTLGASVLIDAVSRQIPGVLGDEDSLKEESFEDQLLAFPQYTRPAEFRGIKVPDILLSGNHAQISEWRETKRVEKTLKLRPDLLKN